jgi:hypothetical protein
MKKLILVLMTVGLFGALPVFAAEMGEMKMDSHGNMMMQTDEGLRQCALQAETIQQKITRIQAEIGKGSSKYSAAHLKTLKLKLKEANDTLDDMQKQ